MGNQQSYDAPVQHTRFGKAQYSSTSMLIKIQIINKQITLEPWIEKRKLYSHIYNIPEVFQIANFKIQDNGACSASCQLTAISNDKMIGTLKQQIQQRQTNQQFFTQQEIWYLILVISRCASKLYVKDNHFIGNVHPYNILYDKSGTYKIIVTNYSYSLPGQLDHFQEYKLHGDSQAYICPQLIGFLHSSKYSKNLEYPQCVDKQSSDIFCLGMTILSMATLSTQMMKCFRPDNSVVRKRINSVNIKKSIMRESGLTSRISTPSSQLSMDNSVHSFISQSNHTNYQSAIKNSNSNAKQSQFNHQFFDPLLDVVRKRYSSTLYDLMIAFLHPDPEVRMRIDRLYFQFLKPFEKQIESFNISWLIPNRMAFGPIEEEALTDGNRFSNCMGQQQPK